MNVFDRYIRVELFSSEADKEGYLNMISLNSNDIYMTVSVQKHLSHLKDEGLITLYNLSKKLYQELLVKKYDTVKIYAGYGTGKNVREFLVATNTILLITLDKSDLNTSKTHLVLSSRFRRKEATPITFKTGMPIWSALNILTKRLKIRALIDNKLKNKILKRDLTVTQPNNAIAQLLRDYEFISISNDLGGGSYDVHFQEIYNSERRKIHISPDNGTLIKAWANIDNESAITFSSLPVINYVIGDAISIKSKWFNQFMSSANEYKDWVKKQRRIERNQSLVESNKDEDDEGEKENIYVITALEYDLDVKGNFEIKIKGKPQDSFKRHIGRGL